MLPIFAFKCPACCNVFRVGVEAFGTIDWRRQDGEDFGCVVLSGVPGMHELHPLRSCSMPIITAVCPHCEAEHGIALGLFLDDWSTPEQRVADLVGQRQLRVVKDDDCDATPSEGTKKDDAACGHAGNNDCDGEIDGPCLGCGAPETACGDCARHQAWCDHEAESSGVVVRFPGRRKE